MLACVAGVSDAGMSRAQPRSRTKAEHQTAEPVQINNIIILFMTDEQTVVRTVIERGYQSKRHDDSKMKCTKAEL